MKKYILASLLAFATIAPTFAQHWIQGSISASTEKISAVDTDNERKSNSISLAPSYIYEINDRWAIGASLNYIYSFSSSSVYDTKAHSNTFGISPLVQYSFWRNEKFRFYGQAMVGYRHAQSKYEDSVIKSDKIKSDYISGSISPKIDYMLNDRFAITTGLGGIYYGKTSSEDTDSNTFSFSLYSDLYLGLKVRLGK